MNSPFISRYSMPYACHHYEAVIDDYLIKRENENNFESGDFQGSKYIAFKKPNVSIPIAKVCVYEFMSENELKEFLDIEEDSMIKQKIDSKMDKEYPKGEPREIFTSMILNVRKFCKKSDFDIERTGAVLSLFYLTHIYTTSKFDISVDKVFSYFKELFFCHILPFPPNKRKIFTHKESKSVLEFFYKIYLRNLPLVRLLCLPNFAFSVTYDDKDGKGNIVEGAQTVEKAENKAKKDEKRPGSKGSSKKNKKKK